MKKGLNIKAQVTVFIIIGIIVVAVAGGVGYSIKVSQDAKLNTEYFSSADIKPQMDNLKFSIFNCLEEVSEGGLKVIGFQGGYYNPPSKSFDMGWAFVPYYYHEGDILMPSKEVIANELADFVNNNMDVCLKKISIGDFELSYNTPKTKVSIKDEEVLFKIDMPIIIKKEDKGITLELGGHPVSQASALNDILEIAKYITDSHELDASMYCITCVADMAEERDVYVHNTVMGDGDVYVIIGENRVSDEPYLFSFMNKYTGDEISDDIALMGDNYEGLPGSAGVGNE